MPVYRVNVVASYPATEPNGPEYPLFEVPHAPHAMRQSDAVVQAIHDWAEEFERREDPPILGVSIAEDPQISPARLTMTVTYEIDAPSEWDARTDALSVFGGQSMSLPTPESVTAHVEEDAEDGT